MSLQGGAVLPCSVTELTRVLGIPGKVASCGWKWIKINESKVCVCVYIYTYIYRSQRACTFAVDITVASR